MNELQKVQDSKFDIFLLIPQKHQLDDQQATALPLAAFGFSDKEIASQTGISEQLISSWLQSDAKFLAALSEYKVNIMNYHQFRLNQAGAMAWNKVFEILGEEAVDALGSKEKRLLQSMQADIAKFVIGQLKIIKDERDVNVNVGNTMRVTEDSAGIIAERLMQLQKEEKYPVVDASYRQIDANTDIDREKIDIEEAPPLIPGMDYGVVEKEGELTRCHVCGEYFLNLPVHVSDTHEIDYFAYKKLYRIGE